jgi:hypothetical protein
MKSPGKPSLRRDVERLFWREIGKGLTSEEAAIAVGASQAAGSRWFRDRGGMPTFMVAPFKGRYLSFEEREEIALLNARGTGVREIARTLKRSPSTISRELRRNAATRAGKLDYRKDSSPINHAPARLTLGPRKRCLQRGRSLHTFQEPVMRESGR